MGEQVPGVGTVGAAGRGALSESEVLSDGDRRSAGRGLALAGEPGSFEAFCRREMSGLVALARALCGSAVADDLAQETMLDAYRRWSTISRYDSPEAWVRRVCANRASSLLRRRAAEGRALLRLAARAQPSSPLEPGHDAFWVEVRRLPRRQAQAAALRYVYEMSVEEIAQTMGCADGTVKAHLSRARRALLERLGEKTEESS